MRTGATLFRITDRLKCGALLLDEQGRVVRLNECARRYLSSKCSRCSLAECEGMYWVTAGTCLAPTKNTDTPGLSLICAPEDPRPLLITVTDVPEDSQKLVVLVDVHETPQLDANLLIRLFNLTQAEANLAVRLAQATTLREIAAATRVGVGTLRIQLKSIFSKTNTHRQAALVALLNRLAIISLSESSESLLVSILSVFTQSASYHSFPRCGSKRKKNGVSSQTGYDAFTFLRFCSVLGTGGEIMLRSACPPTQLRGVHSPIVACMSNCWP